MIDHISKEQVLKYAAGVLPPDDRLRVEQHIEACDVCLAKVTHGQVKLHEACSRVQSLLTAFYDNTLQPADKEFMEKHLFDLRCEGCLEKYHELVDNRAIAADAVAGTGAHFENVKSEQEIAMLMKLKDQYRMLVDGGKNAGIQDSAKKSVKSSQSKKERR